MDARLFGRKDGEFYEKITEIEPLHEKLLDFVIGCEVYYNSFRMERRAAFGAAQLCFINLLS